MLGLSMRRGRLKNPYNKTAELLKFAPVFPRTDDAWLSNLSMLITFGEVKTLLKPNFLSAVLKGKCKHLVEEAQMT